jgi:hypothetical protein
MLNLHNRPLRSLSLQTTITSKHQSLCRPSYLSNHLFVLFAFDCGGSVARVKYHTTDATATQLLHHLYDYATITIDEGVNGGMALSYALITLVSQSPSYPLLYQSL